MQVSLAALLIFTFIFVPTYVAIFFFNLYKIKLRSGFAGAVTHNLLIFGIVFNILPYAIVFGSAKELSWKTPILRLVNPPTVVLTDRLGIWAYYVSLYLLLCALLSLWMVIRIDRHMKRATTNWFTRFFESLGVLDPFAALFHRAGDELEIDVLSRDGEYIYRGVLEQVGPGDCDENRGILLTQVVKIRHEDAEAVAKGEKDIWDSRDTLTRLFIPWDSIGNINLPGFKIEEVLYQQFLLKLKGLAGDAAQPDR
jgi:hypothetical protein